MVYRDAGLIEPIALKDHFFLNYKSRHTDYFFFHAHQGLELLFVHQGIGQAIVGEQFVQVAGGSLLLFQPYQLHRIHMDPGVEYIRSILVFDPALVDSQLQAFPALRHFFRLLWQSELPAQHFALGELSGEASQVLATGAAALQTADSERRLEELCLMVIAMLQLLRRAFAAGEAMLPGLAERPRALRYAEKAMQWIEGHYHEEFHLHRMADELYVSPSHLSRLFHQETGATLTEYLTARRLREACLLLAATKLPVRDIAQRIGLSNLAYFGKLFKKHFAMTPVQYRNRKLTDDNM